MFGLVVRSFEIPGTTVPPSEPTPEHQPTAGIDAPNTPIEVTEPSLHPLPVEEYHKSQNFSRPLCSPETPCNMCSIRLGGEQYRRILMPMGRDDRRADPSTFLAEKRAATAKNAGVSQPLPSPAVEKIRPQDVTKKSGHGRSNSPGLTENAPPLGIIGQAGKKPPVADGGENNQDAAGGSVPPQGKGLRGRHNKQESFCSIYASASFENPKRVNVALPTVSNDTATSNPGTNDPTTPVEAATLGTPSIDTAIPGGPEPTEEQTIVPKDIPFRDLLQMLEEHLEPKDKKTRRKRRPKPNTLSTKEQESLLREQERLRISAACTYTPRIHPRLRIKEPKEGGSFSKFWKATAAKVKRKITGSSKKNSTLRINLVKKNSGRSFV